LAIGAVFLLQVGFTYLPFMHGIFQTAPVALEHGVLCVFVAIAVFLVLELEKWIVRIVNRRQPALSTVG